MTPSATPENYTTLTDVTSPAGQRRAVEGRFVPEELLAAEQLKVWVLDPALAQSLV